MLMIWRGWAGAVAILCLVVGGGLGGALGSAVADGSRMAMVCIGLGLIAGGVGAYLVGNYANQIAPRKKAEEFASRRHAELHTLADEGRFSMGPGHQPPRSVQEAHQQADMLLAREHGEVQQALNNRHHVWFIPAQFWGIIGAAVGAAIIVVGLITGS